MRTKIIQVDLNKDFSDALEEAIYVLKIGGVIVYPTDTLYGLGANVMDKGAVEKVFKIKERDFSKPLPIIARNMKWVKEMAYIYRKEHILEKIWPGKVTVILEKKSVIPDIVTAGHKNVGIRIPDHIFVDKLLGKFGYPITSTSANISGEESSNDISEVINCFLDKEYKPDLIIDVGVLPKSEPSMVVDLTTDQPKILRVGPSKPEQLLKILNINS